MKKVRMSLVAVATCMVAFTACDKKTSNDSKEAGMTIKMTDAPGDYAALNVEIERVDVYSESSGWVTVSNESQMVNVLELTNGVSTTLATSSELEAGLYTQVAVYLGSDNSLQVQSNGDYASLNIGGDGMLVIDINEEISANSSSEVLLDFNVAESVVEVNGEYFLDPTINFIADAETGVQGHVNAEGMASIMLSNGSANFNAYTDANGNFLIQGVAEGTYTLTVVAQGESEGEGGGSVGGSLGLGLSIPGLLEGSLEGQAGATITTSYENVVVVEGEITQMGNITIQ